MLKSLALSFALVAAATGAHAAAIVNGSTLLTAGYANQLETWLGEGAITLTNLYTKQAGDTSTTFHNKVDGKGRTFVVMYGTEGNGNSAIVGGYNPQSWSSIGDYNSVTNPADRTGFLFNLSNTKRYEQRKTAFTGGNYAGYDTGRLQTFNSAIDGPTFGGGHDLWVDFTLNSGYSYLYSYSDDDAPVALSKSLIDGSKYNGGVISWGAIEVFTISAGTPNVPEPMSLALVGVALAAGAAATRRRV